MPKTLVVLKPKKQPSVPSKWTISRQLSSVAVDQAWYCFICEHAEKIAMRQCIAIFSACSQIKHAEKIAMRCTVWKMGTRNVCWTDVKRY